MQDDPSAIRRFEKIEVTGSRIKRLEEEAAVPVQVITRDAMLRNNWRAHGSRSSEVSPPYTM